MTEMGQGTNTVLTQVAAETSAIPYEWITILRPDTALVPNSGPTVASRTTMIIGKLVENASKELREKLNLPAGIQLRAICRCLRLPRAPRYFGAISGARKYFLG